MKNNKILINDKKFKKTFENKDISIKFTNLKQLSSALLKTLLTIE